jgi:hypothetical protein
MTPRPTLPALPKPGATVLVSYFSGIVDERDHIRLGGYPGAFRELLGIRTEEFHPLLEGGEVTLSDGTIGRIWSEHVPRGRGGNPGHLHRLPAGRNPGPGPEDRGPRRRLVPGHTARP